MSFLLPSIMIILVEVLIALVRATEDKEVQGGSDVTFFGWRVPTWIVDLYKHLGGFGFAMGIAWLLADSLKCYVGSLRPHFLDACQPNWDQVKCKGDHNEYIYVEDFHCSNDAHAVEDARRSFPSGHSTYSMCGMIFGILYLQARFRWHQQQTAPKRRLRTRQGLFGAIVEKIYWLVQALVPGLQALMFLYALFVPATRVLEHFHHVRDVCTGMLIGGSMAVFGAFFIIDIRA
ncbi:Lipid phosphate phosphohydrolase 2, related [Eimeria mitis]|uniref:Lipid phosphate phosphohydrolase 2, related n=1 Tax=Eimeria mitis TaxID=44415 RepID=U6JPG2_9EIME|nr:Lipid phosphate phosphohydrolase 2, related [Eimeria mitis]CDJ27385.1 Lipid phosphate phosphohydrolase 2, related [Eimeria mitis]